MQTAAACFIIDEGFSRITDAYILAGHELESPLVAAAGSVNGPNQEAVLREVGILARTAIGAITVGSFTLFPQDGNEAKFGGPVYWHDTATSTTYNAMGLPNIGLEAAVSVSPRLTSVAHDLGKTVIYSCSPTLLPKEHGNSIDQAVRLVYELLQTPADLVELNVSCPNVVTEDGGRKPLLGYDLESMAELIERLCAAVGDTGRLGIKLPPYLSPEQLQLVPQLASILHARPALRFLVTANTIPNQVPRDASGRPVLSVPGGAGGMSGPSTAEIGRAQLGLWRPRTGLDIVSVLGVGSGRELHRRMQLGAAAAGGVTFLWERENWGAAVTDMLDEFVEAQD